MKGNELFSPPLAFTCSLFLLLISEWVGHVGGKPGWLKACAGVETYEVHAGGCSHGVVLRQPIQISCICVHGVWALLKAPCDTSPIILVGKGDCFYLNGAQVQSMKFIGRPSSPFSPRSFLTSGSFNYFWKVSTETGAEIPKIKNVDIININSDKAIYSSRENTCCVRDDLKNGKPTIPVHICLNAPGSKYMLRSRCRRKKELNRIALDYGQGIQLTSANETKLLTATSSCLECSMAKEAPTFETDCCQALPYEDMVDDSNVDPKRYEKQTNRLADKFVDFTIKRKGHDWQVNTHEFNHLRHSSAIVSQICPVPRNVLNTFVRFFRYLVNESISEWPLEKVVNDYQNVRIIKSLEECKASIKDVWTLKRANSCDREIEAVVVSSNKEIKIESGSGTDKHPKFQYDLRDIVIETVWMLINFVGSFCSKDFDENPADLDYLLAGLQKLITTDLTKRWYNPGKSFEAIHFLLHDQNLMDFVRSLEACTLAAESFSTQKKFLTPPVIEETPISKLDSTYIWNDKGVCLMTYLDENFYCSANSKIALHALGHEPPQKEEPIDALVTPEDKRGADFWSPPAQNQSADLMTLMEKIPQMLFDEEKQKRLKHKAVLDIKPGDLTFEEYSTLDEIYAWLERLVAEHPNDMTLTNIGKTFEGRDLKLVKFVKGGKEDRPTIFVDAGIHAREWVAITTGCFITNELVKLLSGEGKNVLDQFNVYVFPVVNPDGYVYTYESKDGRGWRKNRADHGSGNGCLGVDINRNFGFEWGGVGTSENPCEEMYRGPGPFSEEESQALRDAILGAKTKGVKFIAYLSLHSYSQIWLTQWGYSETVPEDYEELVKVADLAVEAIKATHGKTYEVGPAGTMLPPAAGGSDDWAKAQAGIKYSYTIELRPTRESVRGFELPPDEIIPTGEEIWAAFQALCKFWEEHPLS